MLKIAASWSDRSNAKFCQLVLLYLYMQRQLAKDNNVPILFCWKKHSFSTFNLPFSAVMERSVQY